MSDQANATAWTDVAIRTLAFVREAADVDRWRADNGRYLAKLQRLWPDEHQRIEAAIAALPCMAPARAAAL